MSYEAFAACDEFGHFWGPRAARDDVRRIHAGDEGYVYVALAREEGQRLCEVQVRVDDRLGRLLIQGPEDVVTVGECEEAATARGRRLQLT